MSQFVTSEILGGYFRHARALAALRELKGCQDDVARSLVPMGLENLVRKSPDEDVVRTAYGELVGMRGDPSDRVRDQVETSLQRIAARAPDRIP